MEFKEYDFTRNPVVQSEVFFLQSKCTACGFSILGAQLKNWSNTKSYTERNLAPQTSLHNSNLAIRKRSREIVLLHYSRDPQENVTAQLQQGHESLSRLSSSE